MYYGKQKKHSNNLIETFETCLIRNAKDKFDPSMGSILFK